MKYERRAFLDLIGRDESRLYWHVVRDDGVYVREPDADDVRLGFVENQVPHPLGNYDLPALPFPFTLTEFLAFERTALVVYQMSDEEIANLEMNNPLSHQIAAAARGAEQELITFTEAGLSSTCGAAKETSHKTAAAKSVAVASWHKKAQEYASEVWASRPHGTNPSKADIADSVRKRFSKEGVHGPRGPLSSQSIERHALRGWVKPPG